jgi:co-chaperonin GroES (HSP10)
LGLAAAGGGGGGGAAATTDTTAPTGQTGALSQVSTSDSGKLGDNLTGITKPVITGKAEAGSTVEVTFRDPAGKLTGPYKTTADANGNYSLQVPDSLVDTSANTQGTQYTPVIKATDSAGNSSAVDGTKFVVDTQAAAVTAQIDADANNDGYINAAEKGSATTTSVTVILDKTKMVAGDVITLSDGKNTQTVTLTADDIKAGQVVTKDWALPTAEGQELKVKATMTDLAGNKSSETSDSAVVDTVAPTDVGMISKMSIVTDANDDGWINSSELGVATSFISRATLSNAAKVGDKVIFSAKNDDAAAADQSVMLTNADISKGYVEVSFVQPSEGGKQNVTAKYTDAAGNPATDALLSDQASLSTKGTSNKSVDLVSKITTDVSNDGWVNKSEMGNASSFTSRATFTGTKVTVGDFIVFSASNDGLDLTPINYKLTADDISKGYVDVTFDKPVEGKLQKVTTQYMDKAGNKATDAITDEAKLDSKIPSDIKLTIDLDKDNNGYIKSSEKSTATSLTADFSAFKDSVSVGDILTFKIGTNTRDVTIDAKMLSDGKYMLSGWDQENLPTEGSTMVAQVMLKDAVNATDWFKDTAILDFTGLAFTGQKPDIVKTTDPNTLKSIEFIHPQKEDGSFTLWLTDSVKFTGKIVDGVTKYDSAPANFTSAINVTGNDVHLDFVDLAGNETTSVYALGNIKHVVEPSFAFVV